MRTRTSTMPAALAVLLLCVPCVCAEMTGEQEALTIARNYVNFILCNEGNWGGSDSAKVIHIEEFNRADRVLGYFCPIEPQGFLVVSLYKELAPVKAYSTQSNLDPANKEGLTDLIKDKMEHILDALETHLGRPLRADDRIDDLLEINYRAISEILASNAFDPDDYRRPLFLRGGSAGMDYQEGETMLPCNWHQRPPFNHHCPSMGCDWWEYAYFNDNARVGCVATAGAQVMYHWRWPPYGEGPAPFDDWYDWANMCGEYNYDDMGWFNDENGVPVTWDQINAVANLCGEVAVGVDMSFGCGGSGADTADLEDAYEDYLRYDHDGWVVYRDDYEDPVDWFNALKGQFNINRPVPYRVDEHAIVGDGWKEEWVAGRYYWYHMNYGWPTDGNDTWYALDELYLGTEDEFFIAAVVPDSAIGSVLASYYPGASGMWRYFDRDVSGTQSTFGAGQWLQILKSGFILVNNGAAADTIRFYGEPNLHIRFFLDGDPWDLTRVLIQGGGMKIRGGGEMVIR